MTFPAITATLDGDRSRALFLIGIAAVVAAVVALLVVVFAGKGAAQLRAAASAGASGESR